LIMKNTLKKIGQYALQLLIVTFGVYLGTYVNEERGRRKMQKEVNLSVNLILEELESNKEILEKTISYHQELKKNLAPHMSSMKDGDAMKPYFFNEAFKFQKIEGWKGINVIRLEDLAFEGAKINGITQHMDVERLSIISGVYKGQKVTHELSNSVLQQLMNMDSDTKTIDAMIMLQKLTTDVLENEKGLLRMTSESIEKIKELK
ncbi:MAG: hypothetical protein AAGC85_17370, partial [Bacteroidota bacterium]